LHNSVAGTRSSCYTGDVTVDEITLRPITEDEFPAYQTLIATTFGHDLHPEDLELERLVFEIDRSLAVFDGDLLVATAGSFTRDLSVPGAVLPAAHVTAVSVAQTHRRRGLLTRMMRRQLQDIHQAGRESIAVLWASEDAIYGRFGYGLASVRVLIEASNREVTVPPVSAPGRIRQVKATEEVATLAALFDEVRPHRPGFSSRPDAWWRYRLADPEHGRHGATALRTAIHDNGAGQPDGYALWRTRYQEGSLGPRYQVEVKEVVATNLTAYQRLWHFLMNLDLTRKFSCWALATDEPLFYLVNAPSQLGRRIGDNLFLRIIDLPTALTGRRYATPVDVVLEVTDELLPRNTGRWHLTGDATGASCQPTDRPADLTLGIQELGAAYLGGTSLWALGQAGRVVERTPGALSGAAAAFGWHRAPLSIEVF